MLVAAVPLENLARAALVVSRPNCVSVVGLLSIDKAVVLLLLLHSDRMGLDALRFI